MNAAALDLRARRLRFASQIAFDCFQSTDGFNAGLYLTWVSRGAVVRCAMETAARRFIYLPGLMGGCAL